MAQLLQGAHGNQELLDFQEDQCLQQDLAVRVVQKIPLVLVVLYRLLGQEIQQVRLVQLVQEVH